MRRVLWLGSLSMIAVAEAVAAPITLDRSVVTAAGGVSSSMTLRLEVLAGDIAVGSSDDGPRILWHGFWAPLYGPPLSVPEPTGAAFLGAAAPNPSLDFAQMRFEIPRPGRVTLSIHDVAGRTLRTVSWSRLDAGSHDFRWDLRDDGGLRVDAGIYWVRLESEALQASRKLVVLGSE